MDPRLVEFPAMRKFLALGFCLLTSAPLAYAGPGAAYKNSRFGYSFDLPTGLEIRSRLPDGAGATWQTGTVRIEASGANNTYLVKPHELFSEIRAQAGQGLVLESRESGPDFYLYEAVYDKKGRRFHIRLFVSGGAMNTLEFSYNKAYEAQKGALAQRVMKSFRHGNLLESH